jgi:hypothetical protein
MADISKALGIDQRVTINILMAKLTAPLEPLHRSKEYSPREIVMMPDMIKGQI